MQTRHADRIATGITNVSLVAMVGAFSIRFLLYGEDRFWNAIAESQGIAALLGMLLAISPALWLWRTWMLTRMPASTRSVRWRFVAGLLSYWLLWLGLLQALVMRLPFREWFSTHALPVYLLLACAPPAVPWLMSTMKWLRGKRLTGVNTTGLFKAPWFSSAAVATLISPLVLLYGGALYHSCWTPSFLQRPLVSSFKNIRCYTFEEGENTRWFLWHHVQAYWALPADVHAWAARRCLTPISTENTLESLAVIEAASRFGDIQYVPEVTALALDRSVNAEIRAMALNIVENESASQAARIALQIHDEDRNDSLEKYAARMMVPAADKETLIAAYSGRWRWEMCEGLFPHYVSTRTSPGTEAIRSLLQRDLESSRDPEQVTRLLTYLHRDAKPGVDAIALRRSRDSDPAIRKAVACFFMDCQWDEPDTCATILEQALHDENPDVRATIVTGACDILQCHSLVRTAQMKILVQAQEDMSPEVRATLARRLSRQCYYYYYTPELKTLQASLLNKLAADSAPEVRQAFLDALADPKQFEYMPEVRAEVQAILAKK